MAQFELFGCRLGNGTTVCNKAVMEHGDYKTIAHISDAGRIKWYIDDPMDYVPADDLRKIEAWAIADRERYMHQWRMISDLNKYSIMLNTIPYGVLIEHKELKDITDLHSKVSALEKIYFENYA